MNYGSKRMKIRNPSPLSRKSGLWLKGDVTVNQRARNFRRMAVPSGAVATAMYMPAGSEAAERTSVPRATMVPVMSQTVMSHPEALRSEPSKAMRLPALTVVTDDSVSCFSSFQRWRRSLPLLSVYIPPPASLMSVPRQRLPSLRMMT